jgi:hypothetical protein
MRFFQSLTIFWGQYAFFWGVSIAENFLGGAGLFPSISESVLSVETTIHNRDLSVPPCVSLQSLCATEAALAGKHGKYPPFRGRGEAPTNHGQAGPASSPFCSHGGGMTDYSWGLPQLIVAVKVPGNGASVELHGTVRVL